MKYLDEHITSHVSGLTISADGVYNYYIKDYKDYKILFAGNLFLESGTTDVDVEMNDVLESLKPNGHEMALPLQNLNDTLGYFGNYYAVVNGANGTIVPVAMIYRYPNRKTYLEVGLNNLEDSAYTRFNTCLQGCISGVPELLPHFPYADTNDYPFAHTMQIIPKYASTTSVTYNLDVEGRIEAEDVMIYGDKFDNTFMMKLHDFYTNVAKPARDLDYYCVHTDGFVLASSNMWYCEKENYDYQFAVYDNDDELLWNFRIAENHKTYHFEYKTGDDTAVLVFGLPTHATEYDEYLIMSQIDGSWQDKTMHVMFDAWYDFELKRVFFGNLHFHVGDENAEHTYVYMNHKIAAEIDMTCMSKYYLMWQDRFGGYQSQPFDKIDTFSEAITSEKITNYRREQRLSNATITPKWEIQTGWIDEHYYPYYESIFVSPYLILFDTENNHGYNVMITDNQYTEKTYQNQQRKMFNIKLKLEQNKTQIVKY